MARNDEKPLVPQYLSALVPSKRIAFTLAEVLITLGVIGVVAAMTMPVLINKHREQVTVSKVKKFYSTMGQALNFAINENGTVDAWTLETDIETGTSKITGNSLISPLKPYLKIIKDCGAERGCLYDGSSKYLNGTSHTGNYDIESRYYKLILADGTTMWIRGDVNNSESCTESGGGYTGVCGVVFIDVNGKNSPNTIGRDIFEFEILKDRIVPDKTSCNLNGSGWGCAAYILSNGNMNYLHE